MFFIVCLYILFIIFSYILISFGEGLKRKKHKNDDTTADLNVENVSDVKLSKIRILIVNAYEGLYRVVCFRTSRIPLNWLRKYIYKHIFKINIGKNVVIHKGCEVRGGIKLLSVTAQ